MKIAYFDCCSAISGDMVLGTLALHAGKPVGRTAPVAADWLEDFRWEIELCARISRRCATVLSSVVPRFVCLVGLADGCARIR